MHKNKHRSSMYGDENQREEKSVFNLQIRRGRKKNNYSTNILQKPSKERKYNYLPLQAKVERQIPKERSNSKPEIDTQTKHKI